MLKLELSALYGNTEGMVQILLLNIYKYSRRGLTKSHSEIQNNISVVKL